LCGIREISGKHYASSNEQQENIFLQDPDSRGIKKIFCFLGQAARKYFSTGFPRDQEGVMFLKTNSNTIFLRDCWEILKILCLFKWARRK
jgi:hypothetical protein